MFQRSDVQIAQPAHLSLTPYREHRTILRYRRSCGSNPALMYRSAVPERFCFYGLFLRSTDQCQAQARKESYEQTLSQVSANR